MAVVLREEQFPALDPRFPPRKRWTRTELEFFEKHEALEPGSYELIEGELLDQMGKKSPHSTTAHALLVWLSGIFGLRFVQAERCIDVAPADNPTNEPQPDLVVLKKSFESFASSNPVPEDISLIVEGSDSTLSFDLRTKGPLYARAGILEYWVADINARQIVIHRDPRDGHYRSVMAYGESESIAPLAAPDQAFPVASAFL